MELIVIVLFVVGIVFFFRSKSVDDHGRHNQVRDVRPVEQMPRRHLKRQDTEVNEAKSNEKSVATPEASNTDVSAPFDAQSAKHLDQVRVVSGPAYIVDGDTIKVRKQQIRLFGIDAPELDHPYGKKAKWALHKLCKGQTIRAEITDEDDYGRAVARCYLPDGTDLSAEMVKLGLALDWERFSEGAYKDLETGEARKKLFLASARQKGHLHVWKRYEEKQKLKAETRKSQRADEG